MTTNTFLFYNFFFRFMISLILPPQSGSSSVTLVRMKGATDTIPRKTMTHRIKSNRNGTTKTHTTTTTTATTNTISSSSSGSGANTKLERLQSYQRAIFAALFLGYACYTYNRKSVSYATPTLLAAGLLTTNTVGKEKILWLPFKIFSFSSYKALENENL